MRHILQLLFLAFYLNCSAQKDTTFTLYWISPQRHQGNIFVSAKSAPIDKDYYEGFQIIPKVTGILHFSVNASLFSSNTNNLKYQPFGLQVKTKYKMFVNEVVQGKGMYNIPLSTRDTIAVYFIAHPSANDTTNFKFSYIIADTAELNYDNQGSQATFQEMLRLANNGFINLCNSHKINYPTGLFAIYPAERYGDFSENAIVTQYTGRGLDRADADKKTEDWNKQIKKWLNDYNVTDVKKNTKGDIKLNTDEEETVYTKKNAQGIILFVVTVFKEIVGDGTEAEPMSYTTGVRISN